MRRDWLVACQERETNSNFQGMFKNSHCIVRKKVIRAWKSHWQILAAFLVEITRKALIAGRIQVVCVSASSLKWFMLSKTHSKPFSDNSLLPTAPPPAWQFCVQPPRSEFQHEKICSSPASFRILLQLASTLLKHPKKIPIIHHKAQHLHVAGAQRCELYPPMQSNIERCSCHLQWLKSLNEHQVLN